jgi:HK97 family phage prohead protease
MFTKGFDLEFKDVDLKQGIISGQFAKHNVKDLDGDLSVYGTFSKSIQERGPQGKKLIKFLIDHDKTKVPGVITDLYENEDGGFYTMKAGSHSLGQDFIKMVESGIFNQHSYGYSVIKSNYDSEKKANVLKEQKLFEISAIQFLGANPETTFIDLKSETDAIEYLNRLEKFLKTSDATDETLQQIELRLKSLSEIIKAGQSTLENEKADEQIIIDLIKKSFT